jgi:hypothetical protein
LRGEETFARGETARYRSIRVFRWDDERMMMERTRVCLGGDEDARIERIKSKRESRLTETNDPASGATDDADSEKFVSQRRARAGRVQIDGCVEHSNVHH